MSGATQMRAAAATLRVWTGDYPVTVHPDVTAAVAAWLDETAAHADALAQYAAEVGDKPDAYVPKAALATARAVIAHPHIDEYTAFLADVADEKERAS